MERRAGRQAAAHLLGHDLDGGQGRAELVGGGGGEAAEGRQALLAGQHGLGGGERQLHARRLGRRLPGVGGGETDADHQGGQLAPTIEGRQDERRGVGPRQRQRP